MNILTITATYHPSSNGVAISTKRMVDALRSEGHTVRVIGPGYLSRDDASYIPFPSIRSVYGVSPDYPIALPFLGWGAMREITSVHWDIIHVHHPFVYSRFALSLGKRLGCPVVATFHSQYDTFFSTYIPFFGFLKRISVYDRLFLDPFSQMNGVIAPAKWLQDDLRVQFPDQHVSFVSTAALDDLFLQARPWSHRPKNRSSGPVFLTVSRLQLEKNLEFLIRSFSEYRHRYAAGTYVIVGDGTHRTLVESWIKQYDVDEYVRLVGRVPNDELPSIYGEADAFLYASRSDTTALNVLEAMASGVPVISVDSRTGMEIVSDHINGRISKEEPMTFADAMNDTIRQQQRYGRQAQKEAMRYEIRSVAHTLIDVYQDACDRFVQKRAA